eukprot:gene12328-13601_t
MDNREKKDSNEQPKTKFLLPFSPNTPRIERKYNSSVFFTPPYSNEGHSSASKCAPSAKIDGKIPFDLSIGLEDEFKDRYDILRGLGDKQLHFTVCSEIFKYLDDVSLCRASHVSKTWRNIICVKNSESKTRVRTFLSKQKELLKSIGKENVGLQKRLRTNDAALCILENTPPEEIINPKLIKTNTGFAKSGNLIGKETFRPCPNCSSPAKINKEINSAHCSSCCDQFCLNCFRKWNHEHKCELCTNSKTLQSSSPLRSSPKKGKQKKHLSGTKLSKNRLRRLTSNK